ncbi:hypothetical protein Tco_0548945 [Tanacetum coccineum]
MRDMLSVEPLLHVFKKKSLIAMGVIMELYNEVCVWPVIRVVEEDNEAEEEVGGEAANKGVGGSAKMYLNMNQGDWLYLMRRILEVLRKFYWLILEARFNQLSHVSSPLFSKPMEY